MLLHFLPCLFQTLFAKALYDNTAESLDELAFHKGDIVTVMEQNVEGSTGWWKCSLHGKEGLAPANRLMRLSQAEAEALGLRSQSIYQIPKVPQPLEVPSMQATQVTTPFPQKHKTPEVPEGTISPHRVGSQNYSFSTFTLYLMPPSIPQEPNYDIPVPSNSEAHQRVACGYSTMPNLRKSEWIYDVPVAPEKSRGEAVNYGTIPSKCTNSSKQLYDTLPARVWPATSASSLYDIPKSSMAAQQSVDSSKPGNEGIYDVPPAAKQRETPLEVLPLQKQQNLNLNDSDKGPVPLEYRGNSRPMYDFPRGRPSWGRKAEMSNQSQEGAISVESEESVEKGRGLSVPKNQRSSTASTSSTTSSSSRSSCDSLMLSSPSPELLREITAPQEEVSQKLLDLQEVVCKAIPKLMDFVSSSWRCREHLGQHLQEIRIAAEDVANSINSFLDFALDVRGNARRLTDSNLQARLQKQLSIVEDSGLILQQSVEDLGGLGWSLDALVQDPEKPHTPDQLERFVMVARTVPEDVKRLVSILNANGKLLFRSSSKEPESSKSTSPADRTTSLGRNEPLPDSEGDDNDYVQLQTKTEFEQQQQIKEKDDTNEGNKGKQVNDFLRKYTSQSNFCLEYEQTSTIKKAITVFVVSLEEGQPPEKFIAHGKLVIMVGQRLMDSLCSEAQSRPDCQELLCKSNHLCALLKQLAVATKKAAMHFPDKVAIQEARDFAKELAQRAHHFRMSLDL
uniref:SH3 domain-containing protein n=1 Tax=Pygocentrus nattereri TaxID=42514 RepID=A0A3B4CUF3_PYGNA